MGDLEQYIKDNREAFDSGELPAGSRERFMRKLEMVQQNSAVDSSEKSAASAKRGSLRYIFASVASAAAVLLIAFFIGYDGYNENGAADNDNINGMQVVENITVEEYISMMNTLDDEIIEMSRKCDGKIAEEVVKASKSVQKETIPLEDQLPDELSEKKRAEILRQYYKEKTDGLKRIKSFLAVQTVEDI